MMARSCIYTSQAAEESNIQKLTLLAFAKRFAYIAEIARDLKDIYTRNSLEPISE